ncbi:MAG: CPBP family intramembrane metalloprotease [Acidobacteria bacterium]|nr:CPBP family intramembrane metalloprotease [Acidobacteriota bacterium]MBS1864618.1 CPBP family intramembrane metalloprotease [Acidobacteriota bacterium]
MSSTQLTGSEKRALLLWVLAGIVGLVFAQRYFFRAFPEASVDFKVARPQALSEAKTFLHGLGENVEGYRTSIEFKVREEEKVYVERELGLQQANQLSSSQINLWYWNVRFYKILQEEEYAVEVSPSGQIVGYSHVLPAAKPGATIERAAAQEIAQNFLLSKLSKNAEEWTFLPEEANSEKKPNRLDWEFTWEKRGAKIKDAPYREKIHIAGDKPAGAEEGLQVPQAWQRSFERLRSGNNTLAFVFLIPYIAILGLAVWLAIQFTKNGKTKWALAVKLGGVAAGLLFLQALNDYPLWGASYETKDAYGGFVLLQILRALGFAIVTALTITLVLPSAEPLYRQSQPGNLRLAKAFTWRGVRTKEFFSSAVVGISLAAAHIGFIVAFYIVATHYGAWAPADVNYSDSVNTSFPWISGIAIGLLASMNEEFTFRLFAIPFLHRITGSRWIAVIVPAFLWGFLHSNYPQEPAYIRGLEVGLIGIVAGFVMLRWGILATLIWHYTVDASLVGLLLIRSGNLYFKISGVIVGLAAAAPLLFSLASFFKRGSFEPAEDLQNAADPPGELAFENIEEQPERTTTGSRYQPLTGAAIGVLAGLLVLGGFAALKLKQERVGNYLKLPINARQAAALTDNVLRARNTDPSTFKHSTVFLDNSDSSATEFLREKIGVAAVNKIYQEQIPVGLWGTRYLRDDDPEEFFVVLRPDGSLHSVHHAIAEGAAGASLTKEEAVASAEKFLKDQKHLDLSGWAMVDSTSKKQPHRTDHALVWQQNAPLDPGNDKMGHAFARVELRVQGDEVTDYRKFVKIPDDWSRQQKEKDMSRLLYNIAGVLIYVALFAAMLTALIKNYRTDDARTIPWKRISLWSVWSAVAYVLVLAFGDRFALILQQYQTAVPLKLYLLTTSVGLILGGAFSIAALIFVFGLAWFFCRRAFGEERLPNWSGMPGNYYRDALLIGISGIAALAGLEGALGWFSAQHPTAHHAISAAFGSELAARFPAVSAIGGAISHGLMYSALIAAIAGFVAVYVKPLWLRIPLFLVAAAVRIGDWGTPADFAKQYLVNCILLGAIIFGIRWLAGLNLLGIFLAIAGSSMLAGASTFLGRANDFYRHNGYAILAALAIMLAWPWVKWLSAPKASA